MGLVNLGNDFFMKVICWLLLKIALKPQLGYPERRHNHCFNLKKFKLHLIALGCLPNEVVFHLQEDLCRLQFWIFF